MTKEAERMVRTGCEETAAHLAALEKVLLEAGRLGDAGQVGIAFEFFKPVLVKYVPKSPRKKGGPR